MTAMLAGGARWAVDAVMADPRTSSESRRIKEGGCQSGADPAAVSDSARKRQRREMGTLGSGNHYLEVQEMAEVFDAAIAAAYGLKLGE